MNCNMHTKAMVVSSGQRERMLTLLNMWFQTLWYFSLHILIVVLGIPHFQQFMEGVVLLSFFMYSLIYFKFLPILGLFFCAIRNLSCVYISIHRYKKTQKKSMLLQHFLKHRLSLQKFAPGWLDFLCGKMSLFLV